MQEFQNHSDRKVGGPLHILDRTFGGPQIISKWNVDGPRNNAYRKFVASHKNPNQTSTGPGNIFKLEHWNVGGLRNNPNGKLAGFHNTPNRKLDGPNPTLH